MYIVHYFMGQSQLQTEQHVIGPFKDRRVATKYLRATARRLRPKTMRDFEVNSNISSGKPVDILGNNYSTYPDEQVLHSIGVI